MFFECQGGAAEGVLLKQPLTGDDFLFRNAAGAHVHDFPGQGLARLALKQILRQVPSGGGGNLGQHLLAGHLPLGIFQPPTQNDPDALVELVRAMNAELVQKVFR